RRATNCSLSSITEHSFQGIAPSPLQGESVTYVSGTMCYLCLRPLIHYFLQLKPLFSFARPSPILEHLEQLEVELPLARRIRSLHAPIPRGAYPTPREGASRVQTSSLACEPSRNCSGPPNNEQHGAWSYGNA